MAILELIGNSAPYRLYANVSPDGPHSNRIIGILNFEIWETYTMPKRTLLERGTDWTRGP